MKNVRRSLLTSSVSLLLCFVMLIGTTFAWFTDVATSANNIIKTGNLDVSMHWNTDNGTTWKNAEGIGAEPIFDYHNWEPGYTEVRYIKVKNEGNLAFQYRMYIDPTGVVGELADVIDVYYDVVTDNSGFAVPVSFSNMGSLQRLGTLRNVISEDIAIPGGVLLPEGETENGCYSGEVVICVAFHMQEGANNHYQGESIGDSFGITLHATQYSYEKDSFGTEYDSDAKWPERPINASASRALSDSDIVLGALANEVAINGNKVSATIPADVKVESGASSLNLTVKSAETDANLSLSEDASARGFDVHISGIAADNTKPMIVNLGAVLPAGIDATELKLYHTENGTPVQMTRVNSTADFAIHNQYVYNEATGEVTIYVATFSIFSAVKTSADVWDGTSDYSWYNTTAKTFTLNSAKAFAGFRDIVDGTAVIDGKKVADTFSGKTVKLGVDIDLNNINFNPIGYGYTVNNDSNTAFMGTFDGQGHTVYNLYQNGWALGDSYNTAGGGLFASIENATIKNLVVSGADIKFECVDIGIVVGYAQGNCQFENIVVTDSTIANYNRATGAVVGEVCYGSYGTDVTKGYSHTFTNIVVDSNVVVSSLWGSFDTLIGGVIGGKWGNATVHMENVITAAELDVYSDVTAAYQWYAYRRCGMLIGHTEVDSPKKGLNVHEIEFLTCENVEVYYGDWVNYTYYEFAEQDSPTGRNYPWVRAEASPVGNNGAFSNPRYGVPTVGGVKVTALNADNLKSNSTPITFNQLYGGGQGVYGKADHTGVKINNLNETKTIYFQNSGEWENLKLMYVYKALNNTWTTVVEGISLGNAYDTNGIHPIYKVTVPADVDSFTIIGDGEGETTPKIAMSGLVEKHLYYVDGTVKHRAYTGAYETVNFRNDWKWTDIRVYYWFTDGTYDGAPTPGTLMKDNGNDLYYFNVPTDAAGFIISGIKNDNSGNRDQTPDIKLNDVSPNVTYYMLWVNGNTLARTVYLKPNSNWKNDNARFAAYVWNNSGDAWFSMSKFDNDSYSVSIPYNYSNLIFCRMNGSNSTNSWDYKWNQTGNLTIPTDGKNLLTIKAWDGQTDGWSTK